MNKELKIYTSSLKVHPITDARLVELGDEDERMILTVSIETIAVESFYLSVFDDEPNTAPIHKMLTNIIKTLGGGVLKVVIDDLQEGRFFATVHYYNNDGEEFTVKTEVSDALAIAYRMQCDIYVKESLIETSKYDRLNRIYWYTEDEKILQEARELSHEKLVELPPNDLKQLLEIATDTEDFEFAARLKKANDAHDENVRQFKAIIEKAMYENPLKFIEDLKESLKQNMPNAIIEDDWSDDDEDDDN